MADTESDSKWELEELYFDNKSYFNAVFEKIRGAKKTVWVESYIFQIDTIGEKLLSALLEASQREVQVRLLIDGFGSINEIEKIAELARGSKLEIRTFNTLSRWSIFQFSKKNRRLHRKSIIIDSHELFSGSFNILDSNYRESGVFVSGASVKIAALGFENSWMAKPFRAISTPNRKELAVRLNDTLSLRRTYRRDFRQRIEAATDRVWITNAYFVPPISLIQALIRSARSGTKVMLLLPGHSDSRLMKLLTETFYSSLLLGGVRVFEYANQFLHAKTAVIDDWAIVGSSNMNHRSLIHDLEIDVVLQGAQSVNRLASQFEADLAKSREIKLANFEKRPWLLRIVGWTLRIFSYWL